MTYKTLKTDSKSDKGIDVTDFPVINNHTRHNERVGISITTYIVLCCTAPSTSYHRCLIYPDAAMQHKPSLIFQSLAHQASAVHTQKLKLPATNDN